MPFFPRNNRRKRIKELKKEKDFNFVALTLQPYFLYALGSVFLGSFVYLFFNWKIGVIGLLTTIIILYIANQLANTFAVETLGQLANKISNENYKQSRRNPETFNPNEIEIKLKSIFVERLLIKQDTLNRESKFTK